MLCRCCGHDNGNRDSGRCANCGFDLSTQNEGSAERRRALQSKLEGPVGFTERTEFRPPPRSGYGKVLGVLIALTGLAVAFLITRTFERSEYRPELPQRERFSNIEPEIPEDPVATLIGSDIVYVFVDSASRALPRTNVDMNAIPEGATVSFVGEWDTPLRPAVAFILQRIGQREFNPLEIDRICAWTDTTESDFISAPVMRLQEPEADSPPVSVLVKLYFTPAMMRGRVEEFNIQYDKAITTDEFTDAQLNDLVFTMSRRLASRDIEGRRVQVAVLFDYNAYSLGEAVDLLRRIRPAVSDSLGYEGFSLSVFALTD